MEGSEALRVVTAKNKRDLLMAYKTAEFLALAMKGKLERFDRYLPKERKDLSPEQVAEIKEKLQKGRGM